MKKTLFFALLFCATSVVSVAQISKPLIPRESRIEMSLVTTHDNDRAMLYRGSSKADTTVRYYLEIWSGPHTGLSALSTRGERPTHITVQLGAYAQAVAILQSIVDYDWTDDELVPLNNPSGNICKKQRYFGFNGLMVWDDGEQRSEWIGMMSIKHLLKSLKKL